MFETRGGRLLYEKVGYNPACASSMNTREVPLIASEFTSSTLALQAQ